ncbi:MULTISPECIES: class I SAM-dependent methyltransferase [Paenibacillus]|uniref:Phospholipid N-methyltransferase n=1 Tax=Paenibacillus brasilensis TaxID=128574 RepID=A0ABU0KU71_9BACL|nr:MULTISPECIES: methyltransferase domain-containing protein [Paenibacillus]MDQ0492973.1 phospholipid N-methyltransferase [Paenibacillus brasilensis]
MIRISHLVHERFMFLFKFLHSPTYVGSVTPSSRFLAKSMIESIPWSEVHAVAELGAGTGAITQYIPQAARAQTKVLLFEKDQTMQESLKRRFPNYLCYSDSRELQLATKNAEIEQLDCIISGLPFFNFPQAMRNQIVEQIHLSLRDGGLFVAFQYSKQMKQQLGEWFDIEEIKFVPMNIPPAFVYVCRKKA